MDPNQVQELLTQASWTPVITSAGVFEISDLTDDLWNEVRSSRRSGKGVMLAKKYLKLIEAARELERCLDGSAPTSRANTRAPPTAAAAASSSGPAAAESMQMVPFVATAPRDGKKPQAASQPVFFSGKHVLSVYKSSRVWHIYASIFKYGTAAVLFAPLVLLWLVLLALSCTAIFMLRNPDQVVI
jgi:hypothetical protein